MWAAGASRRLAGVDDDHRAALSTICNVAARPAADPPTTATSQWRSTEWGAWSLMDRRIRCPPLHGKSSCGIRKTGTNGLHMGDTNEIAASGPHPAAQPADDVGPVVDDLADRANLSASTISRIETGSGPISLDVLLPLVGACRSTSTSA